jgi:phosphoglycolate phosphatase
MGSSNAQMTRLVVFDLDGTLVNSRKDLADATNAVITDLGGTPFPEHVIGEMVGDGAAVLVRRALTAAGLEPNTPDALQRFLRHYDERLLATTRPYPGVVETLTAVGASRRLAVLTNKPTDAGLRVLEGLQLNHFFSDVIGGDLRFGRKPEPAGLQELIERAGTTADFTMLVGDSHLDLETARRGGTRICLARYGFGYRIRPEAFRGDELFIDDPAGLVGVLDGQLPVISG